MEKTDNGPVLENGASGSKKSRNEILRDIFKRVKEEKEQEEKPVHHYSRMHHRHSRR